MSYTIKNWECENRKVTLQKGAMKIIEHQRDLSVTKGSAHTEYYADKMNVRKRQLQIDLNGTNTCKIQAGAMQMILGGLEMDTGVKSAKGFLGAMAKAAVTKETAVKPIYSGTGSLILEPTYKHILLQDVADWGADGLVIEDGMFLASDGTVTHEVVEIADDFATAMLSGEGIYNLCFKGSGIVALESYVPLEELVEIDLQDDCIKLDGNLAVCWSGSLKLTVEKAAKTYVGSMASGEGLLNVYRGTGKIWVSPVAGTLNSNPQTMKGGETPTSTTSTLGGLFG